MNIEEAHKKLAFADYLLSREESQEYTRATLSHILKAANIGILSLTNLDNNSAGSPQIISEALAKFDSPEINTFSVFYLDLLKMNASNQISKNQVRDALEKVKAFLNYVKEEKEWQNTSQ